MEYDNGEVRPGLNKTWTFMGATVVEWIAGVAVYIMISLFASSPARALPAMLIGWVGTTVGLATLRSKKAIENAMQDRLGEYSGSGERTNLSSNKFW